MAPTMIRIFRDGSMIYKKQPHMTTYRRCVYYTKGQLSLGYYICYFTSSVAISRLLISSSGSIHVRTVDNNVVPVKVCKEEELNWS